MSCRKIGGVVSSSFKNPTVVELTSGTSYTSPADADYLEVYAIGGGGGGGGATSSNAGCGGGAGAVSFKFFPAGTYTYSIGSGGAGGTTSGALVGVSGSAGTQTSFDTLIAPGGAGGSGGSTSGAKRGGLGGGISVTADCNFARQPGYPAEKTTHDTSGQGGSNLFGTGGAGFYSSDVIGSVGQNGLFLGGGGSGGLGADRAGGAGAAGGIIIIEHY